MINKSHLDRLVAAAPALSPAERRVAECLLKNPARFCSLTIDQIADDANVSKPTVVRFSRSAGFDGLADLKIRVARSLPEGTPYVHSRVSPDDSVAETAGKMADNLAAEFLRYARGIDLDALEQATEALCQVRSQGGRVEFYGLGNSGIVAQDAQHKFFRLGITALASADTHVQMMSAMSLQEQDAAVIISNSGRTRHLVDIAHFAHTRGVRVIAITASGSPLAAGGHIHLAADHGEDPEIFSPMVSRMLHLLVVDVLATRVATRLGSQVTKLLIGMKKQLRTERLTTSSSGRSR